MKYSPLKSEIIFLNKNATALNNLSLLLLYVTLE